MTTTYRPNLGLDWPRPWARDFTRWTARLMAAHASLGGDDA